MADAIRRRQPFEGIRYPHSPVVDVVRRASRMPRINMLAPPRQTPVSMRSPAIPACRTVSHTELQRCHPAGACRSSCAREGQIFPQYFLLGVSGRPFRWQHTFPTRGPTTFAVRMRSRSSSADQRYLRSASGAQHRSFALAVAPARQAQREPACVKIVAGREGAGTIRLIYGVLILPPAGTGTWRGKTSDRGPVRRAMRARVASRPSSASTRVDRRRLASCPRPARASPSSPAAA